MITIKNLSKTFNTPTGCLNGLEKADSGSIII